MAEFKHIVRVAGKDLPGKRPVQWALTEVKGVGVAFARAVAYAANIDPFQQMGYLSKEQVQRIEEVLKDPEGHGIPSWVLNRRRDPETGKNLHLVGAEVDLAVKADIARERAIRSYRGIRHELGLPVRGQRTRTTGRRGLTVGVKRKETRLREEAAKRKKE